MGLRGIHSKRADLFILVFSTLVAFGIQTSAGIERPLSPFKVHSDFDLASGKLVFVEYQQQFLEYLKSKNQNVDTNLARVRLNLDAMPDFVGLKSISSSDLSKINQINGKKLDLFNRLSALEKEKISHQVGLKVGLFTLESIADEFPNSLSVEEYNSNKLPRAKIVSFELQEAFPNDFNKAFFIKIKIKSYQPYSINSILIGDGYIDFTNEFQIPRTTEEFKLKYLSEQGSSALINSNSMLKGLRVTQLRKWDGDSVEDTYVLRHINSKKQLSKIQIIVSERTVTDCLNIILDPLSGSLGSGRGDCESIPTKRESVLGKFNNIVGETALEREFNKYFAIYKESFEYGYAASLYTDYPDPFPANTSDLSLKSENLRVDARSLELQIQKNAVVSSLKTSTITCVKGKLSKKVSAVKPVCPTGYKKK